MQKIKKTTKDLGGTLSLSPEYWLSNVSAESFIDGIMLAEIAELQKKGTSTIKQTSLVLDTGNSDKGLLHLPLSELNGGNQRVSNKKIVPEGAVLISRLRPYLQQVSYIPKGLSKKLGVTEILCSTEYYVLTSTTSDSIAFLVAWLLSSQVQSVFQLATTGGHHPRFNDDLLMKLSVSKDLFKNRNKLSDQVEKIVNLHIDSQLGMTSLLDELS